MLIRRLVLFEADWSKEEWPNENERGVIQKMLYQCTILEDSLLTLCSLPYRENIHVSPQTIISILEKMFYNSLNSRFNLVCTNIDIFESILRLSLLENEIQTESKDTDNTVYCYADIIGVVGYSFDPHDLQLTSVRECCHCELPNHQHVD